MNATATLAAANADVDRLNAEITALQADLWVALQARDATLATLAEAATPAELLALWVADPTSDPIAEALHSAITETSPWILRADLWRSTNDALTGEWPLTIDRMGDRTNAEHGSLGLSLALTKDMSDEDCDTLANTIFETLRAYQPEPTRLTCDGDGMWMITVLDRTYAARPTEVRASLWVDGTVGIEDPSAADGEGPSFGTVAEALRHCRDHHWAADTIHAVA